MSKVITLATYRSSQLLSGFRKKIPEDSVAFVDSEETQTVFGLSLDHLESFQAYWNDLDKDPTALEGANHLRRGFGSIQASSVEGIEKVNMVMVDEIERPVTNIYAAVLRPVTPDFFDHPYMKALATNLCALFDEIGGRSTPSQWRINAYPSRVHLHEDLVGFPTTHGLQARDIDFGLSMLIRRDNIVGGATLLSDLAGNLLVDHIMTTPLEMFLVDGRKTMFATYSVERCDPSRDAYRDTLLLSFTRLPEAKA